MKSDALRIAQLSCSTQLTSQAIGVLCDPLWSTILGFVAVHELRKRDLVGPVADDLLYAGIIAVNTARTPGLTDLAGKSIGLVGEVATAAVGGAIASKVLAGAAGAGAAAKAASVAPELLTAGKVAAITGTMGLVMLPSGNRILRIDKNGKPILETAEEKAYWAKQPWYKRWLANRGIL